MGSSGTDRSLGSGISLPQWMKGKVDSRFDFDQNTFSPPSHDDSFFYIRYPKSGNSGPVQQEGFQSISTVLNEQKSNDSQSSHVNSTTAPTAETQISKIKNVSDIDFSKHPRACQAFVPVLKNKEGREITPPPSSAIKTKSQGVDDGFHGEPALCGKSIVHVASRIMSSALGKKIDNPSTDQQMEKSQNVRRGSKSLPVSPITSPISTPETSPKSRRRHVNRFFTGAFIPDRDKYPGGWILSSIRSSRDVHEQRIIEEDEASSQIAPSKQLSRKKSISTQNLSYINTEKVFKDDNTAPQSMIFRAEPSELREMNFWSPTSM